MKINIKANNEKAQKVLEKLVKKKSRGTKIFGFVDQENKYNAVFQFNKIIAGVMSGLGKYVLPQQQKFIDDHLKKEGLTKKDYEVVINE